MANSIKSGDAFRQPENTITVEVVLALAEQQYLRRITVPSDTTLQAAVTASGLADEFPQYVMDGTFGIFGKRAAPDTVLQEGDRVEIYRPLLIDPKSARRRRARKKQHESD
ncbi:MAG: RnfH family protein [Neisseria sp.]|nr:RnfH family protein [Neisseria sp.]